MARDELAHLLRFSDAVLDGQSGIRVFDREKVRAVLGPGGSIGRCAALGRRRDGSALAGHLAEARVRPTLEVILPSRRRI